MIERIEALIEAATPGPWFAYNSMVVPNAAYHDPHPEWSAVADTYVPANAQRERDDRRNALFIAHSRQLLPLMLEVVKASDHFCRDLKASLDPTEVALNNLEFYCAEHLPEAK